MNTTPHNAQPKALPLEWEMLPKSTVKAKPWQHVKVALGRSEGVVVLVVTYVDGAFCASYPIAGQSSARCATLEEAIAAAQDLWANFGTVNRFKCACARNEKCTQRGDGLVFWQSKHRTRQEIFDTILKSKPWRGATVTAEADGWMRVRKGSATMRFRLNAPDGLAPQQ